MRKYELSLYEYYELADDIMARVADEWFYNDSGDFVNNEIDNLIDVYIDTFDSLFDLKLDKDNFEFYEDGYVSQVYLTGNLLFHRNHNSEVIDNYIKEHCGDKKVTLFMDNFSLDYYWENADDRLEVYYIDYPCDMTRTYDRLQKYVIAKIEETLKPLSQEIQDLIDNFNHELRLLQTDIREYLGDDTINDWLCEKGFYFTENGLFINEYERDEIENNLDTLEKAYGTKFEIKED